MGGQGAETSSELAAAGRAATHSHGALALPIPCSSALSHPHTCEGFCVLLYRLCRLARLDGSIARLAQPVRGSQALQQRPHFGGGRQAHQLRQLRLPPLLLGQRAGGGGRGREEGAGRTTCGRTLRLAALLLPLRGSRLLRLEHARQRGELPLQAAAGVALVPRALRPDPEAPGRALLLLAVRAVVLMHGVARILARPAQLAQPQQPLCLRGQHQLRMRHVRRNVLDLR